MRTHVSRSSTTSTAIPDRTVLRRQLEETRSAFHALVESLTDADWHRKTRSTAWTIGEVLTHFANALAGTPEAIEHVRQGKNCLNPPSFLNWLGHLINRRLVQQSARSQTRASILARYDKAHTAMLATVEGMRDDEWGRVLTPTYNCARIKLTTPRYGCSLCEMVFANHRGDGHDQEQDSEYHTRISKPEQVHSRHDSVSFAKGRD